MTGLGYRGRIWLVSVVLGMGCASSPAGKPAAAAPPAPELATDYFPLSPGWKWAYDLEKGQERILATYAVLEQIGDTSIVQAGEERLGYTVTGEGVARREGLKVGDFLLKTPIRAGAGWPLEAGQARVVAVGQTVTVGAGTFPNCVTIEETRTKPDRVARTTYAAGVGPLTIEYQVLNPETGRFDMVLRASLRGLSRPGQDPLGGP